MNLIDLLFTTPASFFLGMCIVIPGILIGIGFTYLLLVCFVDAFHKTNDEFPNKNHWLIILLISSFTPFFWVAALVYYTKFKPSLRIFK